MTNGDKFRAVFGYSILDIPYVSDDQTTWLNEVYDAPINEDPRSDVKPLMDYTLHELFHELYDELNERSQ